MSELVPTPERGQIVRVRSRRYLVEDLTPPPDPGDASLVRLACLDDDAQGQSLDLLWEHEPDAEVLTAESWASLAARDFDEKARFSAYLHTLRWNCVTATDAKLFQSPFRAGIQLHAYQLEPLRKALLLPRVNLFIADDVGLGKTIEAGLIASELLLRRKVRDVVIACPPSVLLQWKDEMESRFGLTFEVLDRAYLHRIRRERGWAANPWSTHTRFIVSHRLLIDEEYTGPLRAWLDGFRAGSLLILDEAHNAAPASGARYAIDSQFTHAIRDVADAFEHRLFLSATPHNGHSNSFTALLEILDRQRFCRGVPIKGKKQLEDVLVRRLKEDIRTLEGGFPKRTVVQVDLDDVPDDAPELVLSRLLDEYRTLRSERLATETKRRQAASMLLTTGLQQRLLSSIHAFARTLRVHRKTVGREWADALERAPARLDPPRALPLLESPVGSDDDESEVTEEELNAAEEAEVEAATLAGLGGLTAPKARDLFAKERQLLSEMVDVANDAEQHPDARVRFLVQWIGKHMCPGLPPIGAPRPPKPLRWNDTRLLLFTEYDDTKRYLETQLRAAIEGTEDADLRIDVFHGPTPPPRREEIKRAFNGPPARHPLRILIATDAAREGVNLQSHCFNLFHFDVPWNPSRLDQRNGRIDRKLQPATEVFCHYFVYTKRPEDRVLQVLVKKTETIKRELGSLSKVIEPRLLGTLKGGIAHREVERLAAAVAAEDIDAAGRETASEELETARKKSAELTRELEELRTLLDASKLKVGFDRDHFRAALDAALAVAGGERLERVTPERSDPHAPYTFPALDRMGGADPTWADTLDTLRAPRKPDQKLWEWRRDAPLKPVVFTAPDTMTEEVVQLHLAQRVVQRLLGRFSAQGFVYHDLSRACLAQTDDALPRVILLGRLSLYGPGAARLHEEILPVTARWIEPSERKGPLKPHRAATDTKETLALLEKALLPESGGNVPEVRAERLRKSAARDVEELLPHLEELGRELAAAAGKQLARRAADEAKKMAEILEAQRTRIQATVEEYEQPQRSFDFDEAAKRQLDSNRRHWTTRLARIDEELEGEPARVRRVYDVHATRIEPVGLVYLWPVTG